MQNRVRDLREQGIAERQPLRGEFEQYDSNRIDVTTLIHFLSKQLLGRHVWQRTADARGRSHRLRLAYGQQRVSREGRQAKVEYLQPAVGRQSQICRFQIAV